MGFRRWSVVAKNAAVSVEESARTEIFYPESDGMPLPDGFYQLDHFTGILLALKLFFDSFITNERDSGVVVSGNTFIYYEEGNPRMFVSPDCYVAFGVSMDSIKRYDTYRVWEVGKVPDFVLEIGSPSTGRQDLGPKRDLYASLGIGEYWMFDPSGGDHYGFALRGERLVDGEYRRMEMREEADGEVWGHSPALNLEFHWVEGSLRIYDPVGERWIRTAEELEAARVAAESERAIAESRAEAAESRAAELEAELRRLRG